MLLLASAVDWVRHDSGQPIPARAVRAGDAGPLFVCRAQLQDGVHPGVTTGGSCLVPQKGKAEPFEIYEVAVGSDYTWRAGDFEGAIVAGKQGRSSDLYVCRATLFEETGARVTAGGKAYRTGPHAGHCYVAHQGREVDVPGGFEVLVSK
jgi:hypothetical protein